MHFFGRVKNLVSHFLSVPAGVRGVVLCALMFFAGVGTVWSATYSTDTTITYSDFAAGDTITINANATLTINLMGQNVSVGTINIGSGGSAGNLIINGPGTLNVGSFDPDESKKNRIEINNYANLVVTGTFWADKNNGADAVTIITGDRTGSLSITGEVNYSTKNDSGVFFDTVNVNVLSDIDNLVKYSWDNIKASISEGIGLTVKRTFKGQANKESIFYKVVFSNSTRANVTGSKEFTKETGVTESKTVSQEILISFNTDPAGEHDFENTGDSAILTLYAPDGVTELATIAYYYQLPVWNGSKSTDGYDVENWGLDAETDESELLGLFKSNQIMLNSGLPRYPVFDVAEKSVEFKSLVVSSGASVTVSAGQLTAGALTVNGSGVMKTTGGTLTISGNSTISNLNLGSAMNVTGGNTVITSLKTNGDCSVEISSGAEVDVTNSYLGENCSGTLSWNGTGTLTIPRSGANVDFGAPVPDYGAKLDVKAAGAATYYSANDLTADGSLILTRVSGSSTGFVRYPYTLNTTTVTKKVSIAGTEYYSSSSKTGYFEVPAGSANKSFTVSGLSDIDDNSSFIMTFYSPDGKFSLGSISYTKTSADAIYWNGTISSDWCTIDNWTRPDGVDVTTDDWQAYDLVVGPTIKDTSTPIARFPNVNNTNIAKSVTILGGAYVTMGNETNLTIGDIKCMGDAYFSATQGTVNFSDGASFTAANPDNSNFNNVKVLGDFTAISKMTVAMDFSAEGLGGKTIRLNDNVIVGGDLLLSGTSAGSLLTITGDAGNYFKISNTQNYGMYLSVADGLKIGENGGSSSVVYKAYYCDRNSAANENPLDWVLSSEGPNEFFWTGKNSTEWANIENWSPKIIPVEADVIIPDGLANYPVLSAAITEKSICIGEEEGSNAKIELNRFGFTVTGTTAGAFTNYGTVVCIENELDAVVMPAESGAVIENGTWQFNWAGANVKKIENHTYKNILISKKVDISGDNGDIVAEKITVSTTSKQKHSVKSSVKITADVVLDTDSQFDTSGTNDFTITGNISGGKSLEILSNGTFKIAGNADVGNFSTSGNAVFAGNFNASGTISVSGITQFEGSGVSIISGGTQTFNGIVTVNSDVDFVAGTSVTPSSVTFKSTVDDGASSDSDRHSIVIGSTSVESSAVFQGIVGGNSELKNLQVKGSASGNGADKIVISSKNSSFAGFKDGTNLTVNGNADIYGDNSFTSFAITGNADIYGDNTFTAFALSGNANIYGNNTFASITIDNSSAAAATTVKFANGTTQTIQNDWSGADNIPFKGKSEGAELLLTSIDAYTPETPNPWKVVFANSGISRENFRYVKVQNSKSVDSIDGSNPLNIMQKKENVLSAGNNFDWFLKTIYKWFGTENEKWSNINNWKDENGSPVIAAPDYTAGTSEIFIDAAASNDLDFNADIATGTELNLKSLEVPADKKISITDCYIIADSISVDGTIALFGTQTNYPLSVNNGGTVVWGENSTIEYYGNASGAKDILYADFDSETGVQKYKNLKVSGDSITFKKALSVAGSFTNDTAGQIVFEKDVKTGSAVSFKSNVSVSSGLIFDIPSVRFSGTFSAVAADSSDDVIIFTGSVISDGDFVATARKTEFKGDVDFSKANFIHNGGDVSFSGTDNIFTVESGGSTVLNNLAVNNSKLTINGSFATAKDFVVEAGAICEMNGSLTVSGSFINKGTYSAGSSSSDSYILSVAKNFINEDSFDAKSGTVLFTSTEVCNISGETKWFNFQSTVPGKTIIFEAGKIQEILNKLVITGAASEDKSANIVLKSSSDSDLWFLNTSAGDANLSVSYASVKDSKCTEKSVVANNSCDLGNTIGWIFPGLIYTWVGNESELWSNAKNWSPASLPGKVSAVLIPSEKSVKADSDIEVQNLTLREKSVFDLGKHKISISGSGNYFENEGTIKLSGIENQMDAVVKNLSESCVEYYGATEENPAKNVIKDEYYNLKISCAADFENLSDDVDVPVKINGNLILAENATMTFRKNVLVAGTVMANGNNLILNGNLEAADIESENGKKLSLIFNGPVEGKTEQTFYYSSLSAKKSFNIQNMDIRNTKVVTNVSLEISGEWKNKGEFSASEGTVKFIENGTVDGNNNFAAFVFEKDAGILSFNGTNTFKSLSLIAPGGTIKFAPGEENSQTVTESLVLKGSKDKLMNLLASSSSRSISEWFINCSNSETADIKYVKVADSYANKSTSARLIALESRNGGNNTNWQFPGLAIALTAAAIGQNQMYIVFDRKVDNLKSNLEKTLYFINSEGKLLSDLKIQKATVIHNSEESSGFACSLTRSIQFEDILNVYVVYRSQGENYIATPTSDFMSDNESHALSDFAVNAVEPLYAYDNRQTSLNADYFKTGIDIEESLAVHDWNEEQQKNGSLIYNSDIFVKVRKNYTADFADPDKKKEKISLYYDSEPDRESQSAYYNSIFAEKLRVWLPSVTSEGNSVLPVDILSRKNNAPKGTLTVESENSEYRYNLNGDSLSLANGIKAGAQVKFLFGLEDREICRAPVVTGNLSGFTVDASNKSPLFALRLKNSHDISSLDLWSFRLKEITAQRGGVTILNNVIDTSRGDIATVKVDMSGAGSLSVIIMTLDGNVVQYLQHGTASAGEHFYSWNGKTKGGKTVARGLYFVRVIGSGFDETRKIMVVRE